MVPPILCIGRTLYHLRLCKAKGVLVAPKWPSSHYWPLLLNDYSKFILDVRAFKGNIVLKHGLNTNSLLGAPYFQGDVLAIFLDCS